MGVAALLGGRLGVVEGGGIVRNSAHLMRAANSESTPMDVCPAVCSSSLLTMHAHLADEGVQVAALLGGRLGVVAGGGGARLSVAVLT